jgi:hypothetical protein
MKTFSLLLLAGLSLALAACDRQGVQTNPRANLDPRMAKQFAASEPQFCAFEFVYSDSKAGIVKSRYVVTGQNQNETLAAFQATCKAGNDAANSQCDAIRKSGVYPCVSTSLFNSAPPTTGLWSCKLDFTANDKPDSIEIPAQSTATAAVAAAFKECASLTDTAEAAAPATTNPLSSAGHLAMIFDEAPVTSPSPNPSVSPSPVPSPTPIPPPPIYVTPSKRRDACAAAMIAKKMTCMNANDLPPVPVPAPAKNHVFRVFKRRH